MPHLVTFKRKKTCKELVTLHTECALIDPFFTHIFRVAGIIAHHNFGCSKRQQITTLTCQVATSRIIFMLEPLKFGITSINYFNAMGMYENVHMCKLRGTACGPQSTNYALFLISGASNINMTSACAF